MRYFKCISFILICLIPIFFFSNRVLCADSHDLGTVLDACFSPDESHVVLGTTKGVFFLDYKSNTITNQFIIPNVWLIKWSSDKNFLLLVLKENNDGYKSSNRDILSVYDIANNVLLSQCYVNIKWYYAMLMGLNETDPESIGLQHSNAVAFSSDNNLIEYIDNNNDFVLYDFRNSKEKFRGKITDEGLYALGSLQNGDFWISTENSKFLITDSFSMKIKNIIDLPVIDEFKEDERKLFQLSSNNDYGIIYRLHNYDDHTWSYTRDGYYIYDIKNNIIAKLGIDMFVDWYDNKPSRFCFANNSQFLYMMNHYQFSWYNTKKINLTDLSTAGSVAFREEGMVEYKGIYMFPDCYSQSGNYLSLFDRKLYMSTVDYSKNQQTTLEIYPNSELSTGIKNFKQY